MNPIRLLAVDDHELIIQGLDKAFTPSTGIELVGTATNGKDALIKTDELKPDLILMDINMSPMNGFEATKALKEKYPEILILLLSTYDSDEYCEQFMESSADGFQLKSVPILILIESIKAVSKKITVIPERCKEHSRSPALSAKDLTHRQLEISRLWATGLDAKTIATRLNKETRTIQKHIENIYARTGVRGKFDLANYLEKNNLL